MTEFARDYRAGKEAAAKVVDSHVAAFPGQIGNALACLAAEIRALPLPEVAEPTEAEVERWGERYRLVCFALCERMGLKPDEIIADSGEEAWMLVGYEACNKFRAARGQG